MEPKVMNSQNRSIRHFRTIAALSLGFSLLAGCSLGSLRANDSSSQSDSLNIDSGASAVDLNFPQTTCGETSTQPQETWYVVYVDRANPDEIRRQYCNDAIGTVRKSTGVPTVQVASFTDYSRALRFASAVGGDVEVATGEQRAAGATPDRTTQTQTNSDTAYLKAADPGSLINIRERATTSAPVRQTGRAGDQIQIADEQQGDDGQIWYKITLGGGQEGWVRSDFVTRNQAGDSTASGNSQVGSINTQTNTQIGNQAEVDSTSRPYTSSSPGTTSSTSSTDRYNTATNSGSYTSTDRYSSSTNSSNSSSSASGGDRYDTNQSGTTEANRYDANTASSSTDSDYSSDYSAEQSSNDGPSLVANDPGAVINVRADATTSASVRHTGYAGDPIHITDVAEGDDGYTWYYVEFDSGVSGWVRGDFVNE
jgi:uncharacterized protein YgiM (DUF1202 family)